ncbi:ubiquitin elongating factor core-domain-containing protein [Trichophaea hybrida]|nr:ubiquitin elongating factor core-domain-containing protein [Trichophaea hybrida]
MSSGPGADADADAIRNKRLARLQAFHPPPAPVETPQESSSMPQASNVSSEASKPQHRPESRLLSSAATPSRSPEISANLKQAASPAPREPKLSPTTPVKPQTPTDGLSPQEAWEDQKLGQIFKVALRPNPRAIASRYMILESLRKDLEDEMPQGENPGKVARLSVDMLDQLILSICGEKGIVPMDHLIGSWRRAMDIQRKTPASRLDAQKIEILKEARRMCVNYVVCCITVPDMFGGTQPSVRLDQRLLTDPEDDRGLPQEVLLELLNKLNEEPDLVDKFKQAFRMLSATLGTMHMSDNYKPYINALGRIAHLKPLAGIFVNLPEFLSDAEPQDLEKAMLLGPFFRISPVQVDVSRQYFSNAKAKSGVVIRDATNALRMASKALQEELAQIVTALCRTSDQVRSRVLEFFAKAINANKKRVAINVDHTTVASDGFMINMTAVLSRLCEPFMDASFSKIDRIDVNYFRRNPKLDIGDETKLNADDQSSKEFYSQTVEGTNSFITEIFFLTAAAYYYGLGATESEHELISKDIPELERHLERIEEDRQKYIGTPALIILDRNIAKIKGRLDGAIAHRYALEVVLFDTTVQAAALLFMRYQMVWLLRLVDSTHQYPRKILTLPLPDPPSKEFSHLPEYMVESVGNIISFVSIYTQEALISSQLSDLLVFAITFLRSSKYIQKATLKSKLVEIIYWGTLPGRSGNGYLGELVHGNPFVLQHLMHALMNFYIEIEKHYYEKFTVRFHISKIIQLIWPNKDYRDKLEQESDHNLDFFVRFVALLLNDVTYVLDNALTALATIRRLQDELEIGEAALTPDEKAEKEKALAKAERDAQSYMQLGNETVIMVNLFTSAIGDSFVQPEIVSRLAGMLDYNLEALAGPKCENLRVRDPKKYKFDPRALLVDIASIYINLCHKKPFIEAIARDGRSYKPEIFVRALGFLKRYHLKSDEDMAALEKLARKVKEIKKREDEEEMELGDVPEEFTDPLMATLMEDPVILPVSGARVDRQTIKAHLLSDATDPFNRSPLKIEDVIPDVELKAKIDAWVEGRRAAVRAEKAAATEPVGDQMDVDED